MAMVGKTMAGSGDSHTKRDDKTTSGGLYKWQRTVWKQTAELNFCVHIAIKGQAKGAKYENRVIGSPVNVLATRLMAEYLQETIERVATEWAIDQGYKSRYVSEAIQYREGMAERIAERLANLQWERMQKARKEKAEREAAQRHPASASSGTSIVLVDIAENESDLNNDFLRGWEPGTTGRRKAEGKAKTAVYHHRRNVWKTGGESLFRETFAGLADLEELVEANIRQDKYDADYEAFLRGEYSETYGKPKKAKIGGTYYRRENAEDRRKSSYAYSLGRAAGNKVNLDRQIDDDKTAKLA
jgi:hypothetical protein